LKPLISESSLTEEDKIVISRAGKEKYLTEGEFYDGYFYRTVEGYILPEHPKLSQLIKEWVGDLNKEIEKGNQEVRTEWDLYCKKYE
jgi:hypothetical protein